MKHTCEETGGLKALGAPLHCSIALNKSKSHLRKINSKTDLLRCGNKLANISIADCETIEFVGETADLEVSWSLELEFDDGGATDEAVGDDCVGGEEHGCVTVIPNIFPCGSASIWVPVSFDANLNAIASSTACWRFRATYNYFKSR